MTLKESIKAYKEELELKEEAIKIIRDKFENSDNKKTFNMFFNPKTSQELKVARILFKYYYQVYCLFINPYVVFIKEENTALNLISNAKKGEYSEYSDVAINGYDFLDYENDDKVRKYAKLIADNVVASSRMNPFELYMFITDNCGILIDNVDDLTKVANYLNELSKRLDTYQLTVNLFNIEFTDKEVINSERVMNKLIKYTDAFDDIVKHYNDAYYDRCNKIEIK